MGSELMPTGPVKHRSGKGLLCALGGEIHQCALGLRDQLPRARIAVALLSETSDARVSKRIHYGKPQAISPVIACNSRKTNVQAST